LGEHDDDLKAFVRESDVDGCASRSMSRSSVPLRTHVDTPRVPIGPIGRSVGRAPSGHDPLGNFRVVIRRRMGHTHTGVYFLYCIRI
jgi:hypothetical protein